MTTKQQPELQALKDSIVLDELVPLLDSAKDKAECGDIAGILEIVDYFRNLEYIRAKITEKDVRMYVYGSGADVFTTSEVYRDMNVFGDKKAMSVVRTALWRMAQDGEIEKDRKRPGLYHRIDTSLKPMEWWNAPDDDLKILFPLGIHELVKIYPRNIIVLSGVKNEGKTGFILRFIDMNLNNQDRQIQEMIETHGIRLLLSEGGDTELKNRIGLIPEIDRELWINNLKVYEKSGDFHHYINPNGITVIDYMEAVEEVWRVGAQIKEINDKMMEEQGTGIVFINLQKNPGAEYGRGGMFSAEKARLYLTMDKNQIKIKHAKNWLSAENNPNGLVRSYKLVKGNIFLPDGNWYHPVDK
jgi:hypothetical protein